MTVLLSDQRADPDAPKTSWRSARPCDSAPSSSASTSSIRPRSSPRRASWRATPSSTAAAARSRIEALEELGRRGLRLTFDDNGPGIPDVELAMKDGYTTGGGLGLGLSGARRLSNEFHIDSAPGRRDPRHDRPLAMNVTAAHCRHRGQSGGRGPAAGVVARRRAWISRRSGAGAPRSSPPSSPRNLAQARARAASCCSGASRTADGDADGMEILALDKGPGSRTWPCRSATGYSTAGTLGHGLGADRAAGRRLRNLYPRHRAPSSPRACGANEPPLRTPAVRITRSAPSTSPRPARTSAATTGPGACVIDRLAIFVADGLGHGLPAHEAATAATRVFAAGHELHAADGWSRTCTRRFARPAEPPSPRCRSISSGGRPPTPGWATSAASCCIRPARVTAWCPTMARRGTPPRRIQEFHYPVPLRSHRRDVLGRPGHPLGPGGLPGPSAAVRLGDCRCPVPRFQPPARRRDGRRAHANGARLPKSCSGLP